VVSVASESRQNLMRVRDAAAVVVSSHTYGFAFSLHRDPGGLVSNYIR
jgi:hypothetical protein